ncbi:hypothetical protein [Mycolicibacterium confluentis]|nr:hypothetical protein [Mycolicibacterium confluentis]MCV7318425.1 hypothetical protein [Mycolicibacterium confluentis]ORV20253.1 hypothetical protein AWB99_07340 [Mycolicibacterium confluentis]
MTNMGTATRRIAAAFALAAAATAVTHGTSAAEPEGTENAGAGNVRYVLATGAPYQFQITYLVNQPASKAEYNANADAYLKRETIMVTPEAPWVFDTTLADPQWAFLQVSSTTRGGVGAPNAHCEVLVDGAVAVTGDNPYSPICMLSQW